jgi:hypothetical protein
MKITFNEFIKEDYDDFKYNFKDEEGFFDDLSKIKDELSKNFGSSFGNNADWGGTVWSILTDDDINGFFIYLGDDDEIILLYRKFDPIEEEYDNSVIFTATDRKSFDKLIKIAKDKDKLKMIQKINKYNV